MYYTVMGTTERKDIEAVSLTQSLNDRESQEQELGEDNPALAQGYEERQQEAARTLNGNHEQSSERLQESTTDNSASQEEEEERRDYHFFCFCIVTNCSKYLCKVMLP